jgi:hypothetical protein
VGRGQDVSGADDGTAAELATSVEESHAPGKLGLLGGAASGNPEVVEAGVLARAALVETGAVLGLG